MQRMTWLSLAAAVLLAVLFPIVFGQFMVASLGKLHLAPQSAGLLAAGIILGSVVNIPVKGVPHDRPLEVHPLSIFGLEGAFPGRTRVIKETVICLNLGGCLIPLAIAAYEIACLADLGAAALWKVAAATAINVAACYAIARPVAGVGIAMPGLVSPLVAALLALLFAPDFAPPVAFVAGVVGPLVGADLLHLKDIGHSPTGFASIGGAGTFDGIVLSGILAAYLA